MGRQSDGEEENEGANVLLWAAAHGDMQDAAHAAASRAGESDELPAVPLEEQVNAAWASHARSPRDAALDGVDAAAEAWVCCDAPECGKWRRVPALVAKLIGDFDQWFCTDARDARVDRCSADQELDNDEIDRRVNAAVAAVAAAAAAAAEVAAAITKDQAKRMQKRKLDMAYRERKKARLAADRREERIAAGLPPDSPPRPPSKTKEPKTLKVPKLPKSPKPPKPAKVPKPPKPPKALPPPPREPTPPPPPPPPRFYPLAMVLCEAEACGKWRRVPKQVAANLGPRDRWVCCMNVTAPAEEQSCKHPQEWVDNDEMLRWLGAQAELEAAARVAGAPIEGETLRGAAEIIAERAESSGLAFDGGRQLSVTQPISVGGSGRSLDSSHQLSTTRPTSVGGESFKGDDEREGEGEAGEGVGQGDGGKGEIDSDNAGAGGSDKDTRPHQPIAAKHEGVQPITISHEDPHWLDTAQHEASEPITSPFAAPALVKALLKEATGVRDFLPRGTVSGFAAEAMTAADEEAHDDPLRADGTPRAMPPPCQRHLPLAAVPVVCGGILGVFLTRRAMFRYPINPHPLP